MAAFADKKWLLNPKSQKYYSAPVAINPKLLYFIFFVVLYSILNRNVKFYFSCPAAVSAGDGAGEDEAGAGEQHHGHPQPRPQPHLQAPRLHPGLHHNRHHTILYLPPPFIEYFYLLCFVQFFAQPISSWIKVWRRGGSVICINI